MKVKLKITLVLDSLIDGHPIDVCHTAIYESLERAVASMRMMAAAENFKKCELIIEKED